MLLAIARQRWVGDGVGDHPHQHAFATPPRVKGAHVCMVYDPRGSPAFLVIMAMPSLNWAQFHVRVAVDGTK